MLLRPVATSKAQNQCRDAAGMFFRNSKNCFPEYGPEFVKSSHYSVLSCRERLPFHPNTHVKPQKGWYAVSIAGQPSLM